MYSNRQSAHSNIWSSSSQEWEDVAAEGKTQHNGIPVASPMQQPPPQQAPQGNDQLLEFLSQMETNEMLSMLLSAIEKPAYKQQPSQPSPMQTYSNQTQLPPQIHQQLLQQAQSMGGGHTQSIAQVKQRQQMQNFQNISYLAQQHATSQQAQQHNTKPLPQRKATPNRQTTSSSLSALLNSLAACTPDESRKLQSSLHKSIASSRPQQQTTLDPETIKNIVFNSARQKSEKLANIETNSANSSEASFDCANLSQHFQTLHRSIQHFTHENAMTCSHARPTADSITKLQTYVTVEFKRGRTAQYETNLYAAPGEHVIVEGDQGEDFGMVVMTWIMPDFLPPLTGKDAEPLPKVLRRATAKEVTYCHQALEELEKHCVEYCQTKVAEYGLVMVVVDAEYQFDRRKLTFFYMACDRQDFRELVRELFKTYRARIWFSRIDQRTGNVSE